MGHFYAVGRELSDEREGVCTNLQQFSIEFRIEIVRHAIRVLKKVPCGARNNSLDRFQVQTPCRDNFGQRILENRNAAFPN